MKSKYSTKELVLIIAILAVSSISTFVAGYFINDLLHPTIPNTSPQASTDPNTPSTNLNSFLPDKHYMLDTIMVINKEEPHETLVASVGRAQGNIRYNQNTRVSYFDGKNWMREIRDDSNDSLSIFSNNIVKKWKIDINPTRVLKEKVTGQITIKNNQVDFATQEFQNEIGMRSLPGYTKFMSRTDGTIQTNGKTSDAYVLYTRIFSLNASDIQFYGVPLGVTTEWLGFWDTKNNFYHIDKTNVVRKTDIYESHEIGVKVDPNTTVSKTFSISSQRDNNNDPKQFTFGFGNPINDTIKVNRLNMNNKAPTPLTIWQMSQVSGTVTTPQGETIKGFGLLEYIKD